MSLPQSDLTATLKGLLDEFGVQYKQNRKSFILTCPRCKKSQKFFLRKVDARFVCWYCKEIDGFSGAGEWGLAEVIGLPAAEIRTRLYGDQEGFSPAYLDLGLEREDFDEVVVEAEHVPTVWDPGFRELTEPAGEPGLRYLESRGVSLEVASEYQIKYHPAESRVVFPVISRGKLLGWQSRYVGQTEFLDPDSEGVVKIPKALTYPGLKRDRVLMFGDRLTGSEHGVLCEGPFDGVKAHRCGGNVVSMGKAVSRQQLQLLRNSGIRKLYLALDPDAFLECQRILSQVVDDIECYDMRPPPHLDLGAMSFGDVVELQRQAPRVTRAYLWIYLNTERKF